MIGEASRPPASGRRRDGGAPRAGRRPGRAVVRAARRRSERSGDRSRDLLFERSTDLGTKLGRVFVLVGGDRVDGGSLHEVILAARHRQVAVVLARHLAAIDVFAGHHLLRSWYAGSPPYP